MRIEINAEISTSWWRFPKFFYKMNWGINVTIQMNNACAFLGKKELEKFKDLWWWPCSNHYRHEPISRYPKLNINDLSFSTAQTVPKNQMKDLASLWILLRDTFWSTNPQTLNSLKSPVMQEVKNQKETWPRFHTPDDKMIFYIINFLE